MKQIVFSCALLVLSTTLCASENVADAYCKLGNAFLSEGNIGQAYKEYQRALARNPQHTHALLQLSTLYFQHKKYQQASPFLERYTAQHPNDQEALIMLAHCYNAQKRAPEAQKVYTTVLALNPQRIDLYFYRAQCINQQHQHTQALEDIERFLARFPEDIPALKLKAKILAQIGHYTAALELLEQLPASHSTAATCAHIYKTIGDTTHAIERYAQALSEQPHNRTYQLGLSYSHLLAGDFERGYELMKTYVITPENQNGLLEDISNISGKRIFIGAEIMLDSMIKHIRFAKKIKEHGGITVVHTPEPLVEIFSDCPFIDEVISTTEQTIPACDFHIPAILLPWLFKEYTSDAVPYLTARDTHTATWHARLARNGHRSIGICWHQHDQHIPAAERPSIATEELNHLFSLQEYNFYALYQKNQIPSLQALENTLQLITLCGAGFSEQPTDISMLLALLDSLDIIITIDHSIAHLAGALGKETYVLLPYHATWHWGTEGTTSTWYPTITLVRQKEPGSWQEAIAEIMERLKSPT